MENPEKIVNFNHYCEKCKYCSRSESEDPCDWCIAHPTNKWSYRPICFEEKRGSK